MQIGALTKGLAWRMSTAFTFQYVGWAGVSDHLTAWGCWEESPCGTPLHLPFMQYGWLQGQKNKICRPWWHHPAPGTAINKAWVWAIGPNKTNLLDTGALALIGGHRFWAACGGNEHRVIPHIWRKPVAGVSMLLSHTWGGHGPKLEIFPCDGWDTLWRGSHHMIMDAMSICKLQHWWQGWHGKCLWHSPFRMSGNQYSLSAE